MAVALAEEAKPEEKVEAKKDKRGLYGLGYGLDSGLGLGYSGWQAPIAYGHGIPITYNHGISTVVTKEVPVAVPHPVAVPVEKQVPYAVKVNHLCSLEENDSRGESKSEGLETDSSDRV